MIQVPKTMIFNNTKHNEFLGFYYCYTTIQAHYRLHARSRNVGLIEKANIRDLDPKHSFIYYIPHIQCFTNLYDYTKYLKIGLAIKCSRESHVIQCTGRCVTPAIWRHTRNAVLCLVRWKLTSELFCGDVGLREYTTFT